MPYNYFEAEPPAGTDDNASTPAFKATLAESPDANP